MIKKRLTRKKNNDSDSDRNTEYKSIFLKRVAPPLSLENVRVWVDTPKTTKKKKISKSSAYKKGRRFEYRVKKHFEKEGYYVKRSYASKGAEDLIAIKAIKVDYRHYASSVLLIQCKNLKAERKLSRQDAMRLIELATKTGAKPILVINRKHKLVIIEVD